MRNQIFVVVASQDPPINGPSCDPFVWVRVQVEKEIALVTVGHVPPTFKKFTMASAKAAP